MTTTSATETGIAAEKSSRIPWWLVLINGVFSTIIGLLLLVTPGASTFVLVQLLGFYWLISGILSIIHIFIDSTMWGWKLLAGLLGIVAGFMIIQNPLWSALLVPTTLVLIVAIQGLLIGIVNLIQAFQGGGWGMGILAALSIIFGLILMANPFVGAAILPIIVGAFGLIGGIAAVFTSLQLR